MFVCINFYFRPYEFLCSSLSFFEYTGAIKKVNKYHFRMVKIVSVLPLMFTFQKVQESGINITTLDQRNLVSMGMCISGSLVKIRS